MRRKSFEYNKKAIENRVSADMRFVVYILMLAIANYRKW